MKDVPVCPLIIDDFSSSFEPPKTDPQVNVVFLRILAKEQQGTVGEFPVNENKL